MSVETAHPSAADRLRDAMVDQLLQWGQLHEGRVETAMRAVPRHQFVPEATLEAAYAQSGVVTHPGPDGRPRSMASAPSVVAAMLEQAEIRPGHRVLEIGAGTGYNAALLSYLVGRDGQVTTIDIDDDVVQGARDGLTAAGYGRVEVICGDGENGHPGNAPYDRIVITAGSWDVPPAWTAQLADGGRIIAPLRFLGLTRSVALEREGDHLHSRSIHYCGFVPLRGAGHVPEPTLQISETPDVSLRLDDHRSADADALRSAMRRSPHHVWLGVLVTGPQLGDVEYWLAPMEGFCRLLAQRETADQGLVPPMYGWGSMAVADQDTLAYLTMREADRDQDGQRTYELGVCAYGPRDQDLVGRVSDRIRTWDRDGRALTDIWIEVHPLGSAPRADGLLAADKRHTRVIVRARQSANGVI